MITGESAPAHLVALPIGLTEREVVTRLHALWTLKASSLYLR
jgi:hypothetical protein